jgi:WD40 repeat protein
LSSDGSYFAASSGYSFFIYNSSDWKLYLEGDYHSAIIYAMSWSPNSPVLASVSQDGTLQLFDVAEKRIVNTVNVSPRVSGEIYWIDEETIMLGSPSRTESQGFEIWNISTNEKIMEFGKNETFQDVDVYGIYFAHIEDGNKLRVFNLLSNETFLTIEFEFDLEQIQWSYNYSQIAVTGEDGWISIVDVNTGNFNSFQETGGAGSFVVGSIEWDRNNDLIVYETNHNNNTVLKQASSNLDYRTLIEFQPVIFGGFNITKDHIFINEENIYLTIIIDTTQQSGFGDTIYNSNLVIWDRRSEATVFVSEQRSVEEFLWLPNGDSVVYTSGSELLVATKE